MDSIEILVLIITWQWHKMAILKIPDRKFGEWSDYICVKENTVNFQMTWTEEFKRKQYLFLQA